MASEKDYIPRSLTNLLGWSNNLDKVLSEIYDSVGISHEQAAEFHAVNVAWAQAMAITSSNETRSRSTIIGRDGKKNAMIAEARKLVGIIQSFPGTTDYQRSRLGITIPKIPSPRGAPGTPYDFKSSLGSIGQLNLTWKNNNATGCLYTIHRKISENSPWEDLGGVGKKKFTDYTFPVGASRIEYKIQAVRSTGASDWGFFTVKIGVSAKGLPLPQSELIRKAA